MLHVDSIEPGDYLCNALNNMTMIVVSVSSCYGCNKYGHRNDVVASVWGMVSESKGTYVCELLHCSGTLTAWFKISENNVDRH